jgi:transposase
MKKYSTILGIDMSKSYFDVCILSDNNSISERINNDSEGYNNFLELLPSDQSCLVCLEHTGIYSYPLCDFLSDRGIGYTLIPALQIKKSLGLQRGKNDKTDAMLIAQYGYRFQEQLRITKLPKKSIMKLKLLFNQRERLLKVKNSIAIPAKEMKGFVDPKLLKDIEKSTKSVVDQIQKQIKFLDDKMLKAIEAESSLKENFELCQSVPGIGPQITIYLLITTMAFKTFQNARQYACYSGIAPFEYSSGSSIKGKSRVSHFANKKAKSLLSMGALNAIRYDRELKAYFDRKVKEGKNKMLVLNAVRNKLIARVFATINRGTPYIQIANY